MKRFLFPIFVMIVVAFAACSGTNTYAGKYTGTFTFIKDSTTKEGSVRMTSNPLNENGILLYGCLPLTQTSTGYFSATSTNGDYISTILSSIIGNNNYINTATEQIKNIKSEAVFNGSTLNLTIYYEVQILSTLQTRVEIIKFTGVKQA